MTRNQYRQARRMCRDNGRFALRWMKPEDSKVMAEVMFSKPIDLLAERQDCYRSMGWGIHLAKSIARHNAAIRAA